LGTLTNSSQGREWWQPNLAEWLRRSRIQPYWWVLILCALFLLPAILIRGAHYEEGTAVALARSIFEDGTWPDAYRYGARFVQRPQGISWLLGAIGLFTGEMPIWLARLPTALALISGASLIYWLVRQHASAAAALIGAVCFIASPMMLQKTVTAEPDIVLSVLLFAALILFWRGYATGGPTPLRWFCIMPVVAAAGLAKGPQPLGYFFLGVGAFLILRRQLSSLLWLGLTGVVAAAAAATWYVAIYQPGDLTVWAQHSRLIAVPLTDLAISSARFCVHVTLELLPGLLLFLPLAWNVIRLRAPKNEDLIVLLVLYAGICTLLLVPWPGALGRYAMPATLAVAAGAGLAYDRFLAQRDLRASVTVWLAALLVLYRLSLNWIVMPAVPAIFRQAAIQGQKIADTTQASNTLLISSRMLDYNVFVYVPGAIRTLSPEEIAKAPRPVFALVSPEELPMLKQAAPTSDIVVRMSGPSKHPWHLVEVR